MTTYQTGADFRRALEERLRTRSLKSGTSLARLRKVVAFDSHPTHFGATTPVGSLLSLLHVSSEGGQADQPDLADFDTPQFSSAQ